MIKGHTHRGTYIYRVTNHKRSHTDDLLCVKYFAIMVDDRYLTVDLHKVYNEILTKAFSQEMSNLEPLSELKEIPKLLLALKKKNHCGLL